MKRMHCMIAGLLSVLAAGGAQAKSVKVLIIGNSFSVSVMKHLPAAAKTVKDCDLTVCSLYIGGCSLQRHWENVEKSLDPSYRPYDVQCNRGKTKYKANIPEMLTADKWDIVTIQQASHESWKPESYHPYADKLIAKIKELAPQSEIVIQQTWAYSKADNRFATWGLSQQEMYDRLTASYLALARQCQLRIIPTGLAVQKFRAALPVTFVPPQPAALKALVEPALPDMGGEVVGQYHWKKDKQTGISTLGCDAPHLNPSGEYLQACVWLAFLFDVDVTHLPYVPAVAGDAARANLIRSCAEQAVKEGLR